MGWIRPDPDVRRMKASPAAEQEIMKLRRAIRKHRDKDENARCWIADLELYEEALPEKVPPGRMDKPREELLGNCRRYINRQKCGGCPISHHKRRNAAKRRTKMQSRPRTRKQ